jgi:hypothetical protein
MTQQSLSLFLSTDARVHLATLLGQNIIGESWGALWCVCGKKRPTRQLLREHALVIFSPGLCLTDFWSGEFAHLVYEDLEQVKEFHGCNHTTRVLSSFPDNQIVNDGRTVLLITGESPVEQKERNLYADVDCNKLKVLADPNAYFLDLLGLQSSQVRIGSRMINPIFAVYLDHGRVQEVFTDEGNLERLLGMS